MITSDQQQEVNQREKEKQFENNKIEKQTNNNEQSLTMLRNIQIILNKDHHHLNVARILSWELDNQSSIEVQYETNGNSLEVFLQKRRSPLQENQIINIFSQILQGYHHLKKLNIIHNNLKVDNIFIKQIHRENTFIVKISNYIQTIISDLPEISISQNAENNKDISQCNEKSEIYSLGIILQQLCYGTRFQNKQELTNQSIKQIENSQIQSQEKLQSENLLQLIQKMIIDDNLKRISWNELITNQDLQPTYLILQQRYFIDLNLIKNEEYFCTFDLQNENLNLLTKRIETNINQNEIEDIRLMKSKGKFENIIEYIEIIEEYPFTYLIMEYWDQKLYEYANDRQFQFTQAELLKFLQEIMKAYLEVQALNFVQVKLNPQNIVTKWNDNYQITFKIFLTGQLKLFTFGNKSPIDMFHFDAPEMILGSTLHQQSYIFSIGAILHYITYGKYVYPSELQNVQELKEFLNNFNQEGFLCLKPFKYFNDLYLQLIDEMLIYSVQSRIEWESLTKKVILILQKSHIIYGQIKQVQMNKEEKEHFHKITMILKKPLKNNDKLKYYDELLDLNPYNQSLYYKKGTQKLFLGYLLYGMRYILQAIECFDQAIKINPKKESAYRMKSYLLSMIGRSQDQIKCQEELIKINPKLDNYRSKALTLRDMSKVDEVIECCDEAIQLDPKDQFAYEMKAVFLKDLQLYDEAIYAYEQLFTLSPNSWDLIVIAECLHIQGRFDEANKKYDEAIQFKPDNTYHYQSKAKFLSKIGKLDEAIEILDKGIETNPNDLTIYSIKVEFLKGLGRQEDAIKCLEIGIKQNPGDIKFLLQQAQFLQQIQKYQEAIEYFDQAILLNPQDTTNYLDKASCLRYLDRYDDAIKCYDWAIQFNPHKDNLFMQKGELLKDIGRYNEAIQCFNTALQIDSNLSYCYVLKGQCLQYQGNYQEALNAYNSALKIDPNESCYFDYKGNCLMLLKQYGEAIKEFNESISIYNGNFLNFYNIAKCLQYLGKYDEAIEYYDKAIQLNSMGYYHQEKQNCLEEQKNCQKAKP
ncbi:unnamed protein product [Paramecium pentaurelia]|uniref:Protein kinase domain-containing protein n=1 Tax=Paramecium pentaurelia TaxID=43138 RepID=A0A8S1S9K5_9CILI|nr:unnamed protein product [Paramecium pentaurelia]